MFENMKFRADVLADSDAIIESITTEDYVM